MAEKDEDVGMLLVSQKTWDKVKSKFPPLIESIFPIMGFINSVEIRVSKFVEDDKIIPIPRKWIDMWKDFTFQPPKFEVRMEPLWMQMIRRFK